MFFGSMGFGLAPDHSWLGFWPFLTGFGEETGLHSLVSLITWFSDKCSAVALVGLFVTDKGLVSQFACAALFWLNSLFHISLCSWFGGDLALWITIIQ